MILRFHLRIIKLVVLVKSTEICNSFKNNISAREVETPTKQILDVTNTKYQKFLLENTTRSPVQLRNIIKMYNK